MTVIRKLLIVAAAGALLTGAGYLVSPQTVISAGRSAIDAVMDFLPSGRDLPESARKKLPETITGETIYKWRDAQGELHYGDEPPDGVDAVPVRDDIGERNVLPGVGGEAGAAGGE